VQRQTIQALALKKGMRVYAKRMATRKLTFGGAGYGEEWSEKENTTLSVYRVGYADGFLRRKENGANGGERNAGNACMDASIRKDKGKRGEWTAVLTSAEETARKTGTISYEVLCAATRRAEYLYP
jgi:alanine racemase